MMQTQVSAESSATYWNEHGNLWSILYKERPKVLFYYRAQEIIIHSIVSAVRPKSIFEYGCGPGRIAKILKSHSGLEVFVADQSPTMLAELEEWADPAWVSTNVFQVDGLHPSLPSEVNKVDIAFTNEVLLHNDPERLSLILKEFERIEPRLVFHIEPLIGEMLEINDHFGCYAHDIESYYKLKGWNTLTYPNVCGQQSLLIASKETLNTIHKRISPIVNYIRDLTEEVQKNYERAQDFEVRPVNLAEEAQSQQRIEYRLAELREKLESERARFGFHLTQACRANMDLLQQQKGEYAEFAKKQEEEIENISRQHKLLRHEHELLSSEIQNRRRQLELLSHWRPFKLVYGIRNLKWRAKSLLTAGRDRLVLTSRNHVPVHVMHIAINGDNLVPEFLYRTSPTARVEHPKVGPGVILCNGAIAIYGAKSWRIKFSQLPSDAEVGIAWNGKHWNFSPDDINAEGGSVDLENLMKKDHIA